MLQALEASDNHEWTGHARERTLGEKKNAKSTEKRQRNKKKKPIMPPNDAKQRPRDALTAHRKETCEKSSGCAPRPASIGTPPQHSIYKPTH